MDEKVLPHKKGRHQSCEDECWFCREVRMQRNLSGKRKKKKEKK